MKNTTAPQIGVLRIIWAALLVGQIGFLTVVLYLLRTLRFTRPGADFRVFPYVAAGMLGMCLMIGFIARTLIMRRGRQDPATFAASFASANIIFWAACEGPSMFAIVVILLTRSTWPEIVLVIIPMVLQALTFPFAPDRERFARTSDSHA